MKPIFHLRRIFVVLSLVIVLVTTSACGAVQARESVSQTGNQPTIAYRQLERGDTRAGQSFGDWVVKTGQGLVQDAYVRGNDKLGVVISPQVRPNEVKSLAKSLVQGFHKNAPNRNLTVLMYAPDKNLILTARYDDTTKQIQYQ